MAIVSVPGVRIQGSVGSVYGDESTTDGDALPEGPEARSKDKRSAVVRAPVRCGPVALARSRIRMSTVVALQANAELG